MLIIVMTLLQTHLYIAVGAATSVAVLVATAFSLLVLVPTLSQVTAGVDNQLDARVLSAVSFSKYATNSTYVGRFEALTARLFYSHFHIL